MAIQSITIQLPDPVYKQIAQRAQRKQRSLEDEVASVVANSIPTVEDLPIDLVDSLEQLAFLTDAELWQAAQIKLSDGESAEMQKLVTKQQRQGLAPREQRRAENLVNRYQRTMLIRAQSALLLKERGQNIEMLHPDFER